MFLVSMETTVRQSVGNVKMVQDVTRLLGYVQTDAEITGLYLIAQVVCYCWFIITNICTRKFLNWHINPELHSNWLRQMHIPNNDIIILCRKEYQNWLQIGKLIWFTLIDLLDCEPYKYGPNCAFDCGHCKHDKPCSMDTGDCPSGCVDGWTGKHCLTGKWRHNYSRTHFSNFFTKWFTV